MGSKKNKGKNYEQLLFLRNLYKKKGITKLMANGQHTILLYNKRQNNKFKRNYIHIVYNSIT